MGLKDSFVFHPTQKILVSPRQQVKFFEDFYNCNWQEWVPLEVTQVKLIFLQMWRRRRQIWYFKACAKK